jgi:flagellar biogenesis protein FliO
MQAEAVGSGVPSVWRGMSAALFVVGLVFLLYGIVKWIKPKQLFKVPAEVEVITELPMPGGKKVVLARILDRCYLLGLTKDGITLLDRVADLDIREGKSYDAAVGRRETAEIARQKVISAGLNTAFSGGFKAVNRPSVSSRGTYTPFINRPGEVKRAKAQAVPVKISSPREVSGAPKKELGFTNGDSARKEYLLSRIRSEIERLS